MSVGRLVDGQLGRLQNDISKKKKKKARSQTKKKTGNEEAKDKKNKGKKRGADITVYSQFPGSRSRSRFDAKSKRK